MNKKNLIGH